MGSSSSHRRDSLTDGAHHPCFVLLLRRSRRTARWMSVCHPRHRLSAWPTNRKACGRWRPRGSVMGRSEKCAAAELCHVDDQPDPNASGTGRSHSRAMGSTTPLPHEMVIWNTINKLPSLFKRYMYFGRLQAWIMHDQP